LAALYLRGVPRPIQPSRRRWSRVASCIRCADCDFSLFPEVLRANGLWEEAIVLETLDVVEFVLERYDRNAVVTAVDPLYPRLWLEKLGDGAPPALWIRGTLPDKPLLGIVGSRHIEEAVRGFAEQIGRESVRLGYSVVSGGAAGCDQAGVHGALLEGGQAVNILPAGLRSFGFDGNDEEGACCLSVCAPEETFTTGTAMERNALIYAAADASVIAHARFKQGGTWIGSVEAIRRKLCPMIVREDESQASRALIGLGGTPITYPGLLGEAMSKPPSQRGLFGIG